MWTDRIGPLAAMLALRQEPAGELQARTGAVHNRLHFPRHRRLRNHDSHDNHDSRRSSLLSLRSRAQSRLTHEALRLPHQ